MKLGMPSLIELNTIEDNLELCKKLGFDFIELNMNFPYNMINNINPHYLYKLGIENNIEFTMHMPDDADIGSFYDEVRSGYLKLFIDTIKWSSKANVKLLNMHISKGAFMTMPDKKIYINEKYFDKYRKNFLESMQIISKEAAMYNIMICIENSSNFALGYVEKLVEESLLLDNIYLTWDVGHDYISNFTDKSVLLRFEDKIKHMHLHDASQNKDHLALNDGKLNIKELLSYANKNNLTTLIEVKSKKALIKSKEQMDVLLIN